MANVTVLNGTMDEKEINGYIDIIEKENPSRKLDSLELTIDGDFVNMKYTFKPINFERIRGTDGTTRRRLRSTTG